MKNLKPLHDNILVKIDKATEKKTSGGIVLTGKTKKEENYGTVLSLGPDTPSDLEVGMKVMFVDTAIVTTELDDGTEARLYKAESILGIVIEDR